MDDEQKISDLTKICDTVSVLADDAYDILKSLKNRGIDDENINSWLKKYNITAVEIFRNNNRPTIH